MIFRPPAIVCSLCAVVGLSGACANGGADDLGVFGDGGGGEAGSSSGASSGAASSSGAGSSSGAASSSGSGSGSTSGSSSGSTGGDDGGSAEAGDDGGSGDDGGANAACGVSPDQCDANATPLPSIAGDQSGPTVGASGYTSEWLRIDVTEQDSNIVGKKLTLTAALTSPPGMNYDLYAYLGGSVGDIQCSNPKAQSTSTTGVDQVSFQWGEGSISNGSDDSATVMLEIRWVSGACTNTQNWSLSAHGD